MQKAEFRRADIAAASGDKAQEVEGYAAVFNAPTLLYTVDGISIYEVIDAGAFDGADMADVVLRYNHMENFTILARTSNDTLHLAIDDKGLKVTAALAATTQGKDIYELICRKDIAKMSYGFIVDQEYCEKVSEMKYVRHISKIARVVDVSVVDIPAYDDTSIDIARRSMAAFMEEILTARKEHLRLKSKM